MIDIIKYMTLFAFGSLIGWIGELFYRRLISFKKWVNPGFLMGPYLPLYGCGICIFHAVFGTNIWWFWKIILITTIVTLNELIAGIIFIGGLRIKLWDYTDRPLNYKGIICFKFSLIWGIFALMYLFLLYPLINSMLEVVNFKYWQLIIGVFYGILFIDFVISLYWAFIMRLIAKDEQSAVSYESLKIFLIEESKKTKKKHKRTYLFPFKFVDEFKENIRAFLRSEPKDNK